MPAVPVPLVGGKDFGLHSTKSVCKAQQGTAVWESSLSLQLMLLMCREWIDGGIYSTNARLLLHTQYHQREAPITAKLNDW